MRMRTGFDGNRARPHDEMVEKIRNKIALHVESVHKGDCGEADLHIRRAKGNEFLLDVKVPLLNLNSSMWSISLRALHQARHSKPKTFFALARSESVDEVIVATYDQIDASIVGNPRMPNGNGSNCEWVLVAMPNDSVPILDFFGIRNDSLAISQKTLFGGEERVGTGHSLTKSAVLEIENESLRRGRSLTKTEMRVMCEWLTLSFYPGARDIMEAILEAFKANVPLVRAVLRINPRLDSPCFDTISRNVRDVVNGK